MTNYGRCPTPINPITSAQAAEGASLTRRQIAPGAVAFNAACHLASAGLLSRIRPREPAVRRLGERPRLHREITTGLRYVTGQPILRRVALHGMIALLFEYALLTVQPLLLVSTLGLRPAVYGMVTGAVAVGGVVGSMLANRVISKLGIARTLWLPMAVTFPLLLVMPLVGGGWLVALYPLGYAAYIGGSAVQNVAQLTYRQAVCPPELHGRMNSAMRFLMWGMMPVGGLLGGFLARVIGERNALWVCVIGMLASVLPLLGRPVLRLSRDA